MIKFSGKNIQIVAIIKIPPENGGFISFPVNFLWNDMFFLSLIKLNLLNKKFKTIINKKTIKKLS